MGTVFRKYQRKEIKVESVGKSPSERIPRAAEPESRLSLPVPVFEDPSPEYNMSLYCHGK